METFKKFRPKKGLPKIATATFRAMHGKPPLKQKQPKQTVKPMLEKP